MEGHGGQEQAVREVIGWIQRITVEQLGLDLSPIELNPDREFNQMEVVTLDSIDLLEVVTVLEDALGTELLEDDEFREAGLTIRCMAKFLISRFGREQVCELARSAESCHGPH